MTIVFTPATLPTLTQGVAITPIDVSCTGATSAVTPVPPATSDGGEFVVSRGALPTGLHFDGEQISGTPTVVGDYSFELTVYYEAGNELGVHSYSGTVVENQNLLLHAVNPVTHNLVIVTVAPFKRMTSSVNGELFVFGENDTVQVHASEVAGLREEGTIV